MYPTDKGNLELCCKLAQNTASKSGHRKLESPKKIQRDSVNSK